MKSALIVIHPILIVVATAAPICTFGDYSRDYVNGISWYHTGGTLGYYDGHYRQAISTSTKGSITIPSSLGNYTITALGPHCFYQCSALTSVTIPSTVKSIGEEAFTYCGGIREITIPDSVLTIGNTAFMDCTNLTSIALPATLDQIADNLLRGCQNIRYLQLPNTITNIGEYAFCKTGISTITIPRNVRNIGRYAFYGCTNLTQLKIPKTVKRIGNLAFCVVDSYAMKGKLRSVEFEGNAPSLGGGWPLFASHTVNSNCCSYVRKSSTGWGVEIPGFWQNARIDYAKYTISFLTNGGSGTMADQSVYIGEDTDLSACSFSWNDYVFAGWSVEPDGPIVFEDEEVVLDLAGLNETVALYAQWAPSKPAITPVGSTEFSNASQEVSISCATEGATILFTTDGTDPLRNGRTYTRPFNVYNSCVIRAVAVKTGLLESKETTAVLTRADSLSEAANLYGYLMETDDGMPWTVVTDVSHDGVSSVRSGGIGNDGATFLRTSVKKSGTVSFWWRASCEDADEEDGEDGYYDYGAFLVDGAVAARIAGNDTGWQKVVYFVPNGGKHILQWEYRKDNATTFAPDCVWVDQVQWIPADGSGHTLTTPDPVLYAWLSEHDLGTDTDYESAAHATAENGVNKVWECYVAGLDPTDENARFSATIALNANGKPEISHLPPLSAEEEAKREYRILGAETLDAPEPWTDVTDVPDPDAAGYRFFKVTVRMKE